jgi:hypothetical protein
MIKRFRELDKYQKGMIIVMAAMAVIFAVLTLKTVSKKGFNYRGTILTKTEENGSTVYSGTRKGMATSFTIGPDSGIVYRFGDKKYGPYYVKIDNSLLEPGISPNDETGYEILKGDEVIFRGSVRDTGAALLFYNENGDFESFGNNYIESNGIVMMDGKVLDQDEPTKAELIEIHTGPEATSKGNMALWFVGVVLCLLNTLSIIFADEIFRFYLSFRIAHPEDAEPTDWEITSRYLSWIIMFFPIIIFFSMGLK